MRYLQGKYGGIERKLTENMAGQGGIQGKRSYRRNVTYNKNKRQK